MYGEFCDIYSPNAEKEEKKIEIKIRFKSGNTGYFELKDDDINVLFNALGDAIRDGANGVLELIDLSDNKRTIVNVKEIVSFGYKEVIK